MHARFSAVQQALVILTISAFAVAALVHPAPENGAYSRALSELTSVEQRFDRDRVEQLLFSHAQASGKQPLAPVTQQVAALRPLSLQLSSPSLSVDPLLEVQVRNLAEIERFTRADATVPAALADLSSVPRSLAWRLMHAIPTSGPLTLRSAQLQPSDITREDLTREDAVFDLQSAKLSAAASVGKASARADELDKLYEARVKWRVSRKLRVETYQAKQDAHKALREAQRTQREADKRYTLAATAALSIKPQLPASSASASGRGVLRLEIERPEGLVVYAIPVQVRAQSLPIPPLQGASFQATHAAGLWDAVSGLDVPGARKLVEQQFTWHYRHVDLGGIKFGGMTVLQLLPCVLPLLLQLLLTRMRAVSLEYNPFRTRVRSALPRIGFKARILDAVAVVLLPLTAAAFASSSLVLVGQVPALPLMAAAACLLLGGYAFIKLGELQRLAEDVVRSHSVPPAEPL